MPGQTPFPILLQFFCVIEQRTGMPPQPLDVERPILPSDRQDDAAPEKLPKGVVLGPDGKP